MSSSSSKKVSSKKTQNKKQTKKYDEVNKMPELVDEDESEDDMEFDADEEKFFDADNFREYSDKIKFRVFDPEKYENETRKEIIIVPKQYRKTSEKITKFEFTSIVSNRAKQIENGSIVFADIGGETDPIVMAEIEVRKKKCPLSIRRMLNYNIAEIWDVNEMTVLY